MAEILLDGRTLSAAQLTQIMCGAPAGLCPDAQERMMTSAAWFTARPDHAVLRMKWAWLMGGAKPPDTHQALLRSWFDGHCAGVGDPLPPTWVRAMIAARVNVLATGVTGCRPELAQMLIAMLNHDVVPVVPSQGSVGAAGSTALAHMARVALRYGGEAWRKGERLPAEQAMAGLPHVIPTEKEALSLVNGATLTASLAAIACVRARTLLETAEIACALTFEVVRADLGCLSHAALAARGHPGAVAVGQRLRDLLSGSELVHEGRVPDSFSLRCAPAVLGAAKDCLEYVETVVTRELNGACDNPLVFAPDGVIEAGNFHAAGVALAMDQLKIAMTQVASIAERRVFRLTHGQLSGLPSFLLPATGLNSGLMLAQYTAASLVSECKGLAFPASVDSVPTVQHQEDHVSMGPIAAKGALAITECVADILAIELLSGAQGLDFRLAGEAVDDLGNPISVPPLRPGPRTLAAWQRIREQVSRWTDDRALYPDLRSLGEAVRSGEFTQDPLPWGDGDSV